MVIDGIRLKFNNLNIGNYQYSSKIKVPYPQL